jgi:ferredoxin
MRVFVDPAKCADHGQCVFAAPEVFRLDENGKLLYESDPDADIPDLADKVEEAADVCPLQAISLLD